jgi:hypothetical protein
MLELKLEDGKQKYANCSSEIKAFALANFKPGDDVDIQYVPEGNLIKVTAIAKPGALPVVATTAPALAAVAPATQPSQASACPVTGTAIQTPQAVVAKQEPPKTSYRQDLAPEVSRSIRRQSVMNSACTAVVAVQSQVDPNGLGDYIVALFNKLIAEVEK